MPKIRIMLVEDHALVREGTKELLARDPDLQVVAEAGTAEEAVQLAAEHRPDIILMDVALPGVDGIEATRQIKDQNPTVAVIALTAYDHDQYIFALLEAGAAGYLLKDVSAQDLIEAIRAVHAGESVLHPTIARKVVNYFAQHAGKVRTPGAAHTLTRREMDVLKLAAKGMTNREIAAELVLSVRTVQVHLSHVFTKLETGSRTEAVLQALREGWLTLEDTSREGP